MNFVRRIVVFHLARLPEVVLVLAVLLLAAQLMWLPARHWWRLPRAGTTGFDTFHATSMASEFVIQLPKSYRQGQLLPLLVFLHGGGERGTDPSILLGQEPFRRTLPCIVVAPQCLPTYTWVPDSVADFIEYIASRYQVDRGRIYVVGYSMGGNGAWQTAAAHPHLLAGVVSISGGGASKSAKALAKVPMWAFHGEQDDNVPLAQTQTMIDAIRAAGGKPRLTIYPNAGHGICKLACNRVDLWDWLLQQHGNK